MGWEHFWRNILFYYSFLPLCTLRRPSTTAKYSRTAKLELSQAVAQAKVINHY